MHKLIDAMMRIAGPGVPALTIKDEAERLWKQTRGRSRFETEMTIRPFVEKYTLGAGDRIDAVNQICVALGVPPASDVETDAERIAALLTSYFQTDRAIIVANNLLMTRPSREMLVEIFSAFDLAFLAPKIADIIHDRPITFKNRAALVEACHQTGIRNPHPIADALIAASKRDV